MTLTEILPTMRRSLPDPLDSFAWPEHTIPTISDVIVAGVSLVRLAEVSGSPALLSGDLPHPQARTVRTRGVGNDVTVLVFRIALRVDTQQNKRIALTDCSLDTVEARWDQCRLIGRTSVARSADIELISAEAAAPHWPYPVVTLPEDVHEGDLLAVPCSGAVALREVRPRRNDVASPAINEGSAFA
ncbi:MULTISPECIES: hypothetical protein [unclassified Microbacterium]|uniref:hypothetical protein n=1 Tax=unclassified Microbacterium TaxID=2609290 RepID=UPI0021A5BEDD|nr:MULTISPECIES: hypothetical protein [unclassified Microbacterium]MCT1364097.1 hypothetical protein [Microbacterium sp. p3-SID131]MCT1375261.1 hypothetical protein [Microbacterium sp. p3-SID337]